MKDNVCKHCGAVNQHYSFQCATQRKPIKKSPTKIGDYTIAKHTPIAKVSDKQKKINVAYTALRKAYLQTHPLCEAKLKPCTGTATDIHHLIFGSNKRKNYLNDSTFKAVCRECHTYLHSELSTEELVELGLRILD